MRHVYTYTRAYNSMLTYIHAHMYTYTNAYLCTYTHIHAYTYSYTYMPSHIHIYMCEYRYLHACCENKFKTNTRNTHQTVALTIVTMRRTRKE